MADTVTAADTVTVTNRCKLGVSLTTTAFYQRMPPVLDGEYGYGYDSKYCDCDKPM